jgi:photosystem II stability/assembly factor-like uncharacterized protein
MKKLFSICLLFITGALMAQPSATTSSDVRQALQAKEQLTKSSLVKNLPFRNIGPSVMSGRVVDIAVNPDNPIEFYVGYASGGVWHTQNNGISFEPVMDSSPTQNVGSLAVDWKNRTVWVGTGEVNASRSSYAGIGLLKSTDQGKTWENMGLTDSHHISRILINPSDPNEIVVGVLGHLYSKNTERGIFKTRDGGKTWNQTLFVNDESGIVEIDVHPNDFTMMYASSWDKDRKAWNFRGSGTGSAIYKSTDSGNSWTKLTSSDSGFPTGDGVGRIGLAVYDDQTVYAILDNQFLRKSDEKEEPAEGLKKENFKSMSQEQFLALDNSSLESFLRNNNFQKKYTAESVKDMIRSEKAKPIDLPKYLEDANTLLFDTPVVGAEVYRSSDGGKTWRKTHEEYLDDIYYSYGYYFGKIHVDPSNSESIYIYGVPILNSKDGGKSFVSLDADNLHGDHHVLWINPKVPGHLINGNDGGVNISYDNGAHWKKCNTPAVGQFYAIAVDNAKPYNVYGGIQDNGVWKGSSEAEEGVYWYQSGQYPYKMLLGGDGMQVQVDHRNNNIVYTGYQFGNYYRLNLETNENAYIQPKHELGENPYRFNWQSPILLSSHNQDILYFGGNKLMRSMNQGDDWQAISPDLTTGGKVGNVAYGTLTTLSESPLQFGLIYTGSDDGQVHVTRDSGGSWQKISDDFPKDLWVSRVVASGHEKSRVYVSLNGYRWDDFNPYVYVSDDFGNSWRSLASNLPASPVNVLREDPVNENVLYLGTDNGAYVTLDRGESWEPFSKNLPNVAFHDMVVQPEAKDLVLGTHGRSLFIGDISLLQQLSKENMGEIMVNDLDPIPASRRWGRSYSQWDQPYEPSVDIQFYTPQNGKVVFKIISEDGKELNQWEMDANKGVNLTVYDLTLSEKGIKNMEKAAVKIKAAENGKTYLVKGTYQLEISVSSKKAVQTFEVK